MAIYHTRVKTFSRAKGHTSTAAAAYRAGLLIPDSRTGIKHDYRRRSGVVDTRVVAPDDAPEWAFDPCELWDQAEATERRKDATVAREFEIALPHELNDDQRSSLTSAIAKALVERYRFVVQASIHSPPTPNGQNYHVHMLATTRRVGPEGLTEKTRELDGGPSGRGEVEWIRGMVAKTINVHLSIAGIASRVDHRSLADQAQAALDQGDFNGALILNRRPTQHVGKEAAALHRKGAECDRMQVNQAIAEANEAHWQKAIAQLEERGRLLPTPEGHSQVQQADKEHQEPAPAGAPEFRLPPALSPAHDDNQIWVVRRQAGSAPSGGSAPPSRPMRPVNAEREELTRLALEEAADLWSEGFFSTVSATVKATTALLRHHADRLAAYVQNALFRSDVRELLKRVKQFKRDATRFQRRLKAEERAGYLLGQAELALERFDGDYPVPGQLARQEWARRRARRLRAVRMQRKACQQAHEATGPQAQDAYNAQAVASAQQLEAWSGSMLKRYPVPADRPQGPDTASAVSPGPDPATGLANQPRP